MTLEALKFFNSKEGKKLLKEYKVLNNSELNLLAFKLAKKKNKYSAEIITLLKLRNKAKDKFSLASEMFFTSDGLEQSSSELLANYITSKFKKLFKRSSLIIDLTCGIGINSIFLAKYFKVKAVDINEVHLKCAYYNSKVYKVDKNIEFILAKSEDSIRKAQAYFIDPQRLREGQTKTRSIYNSQPNIINLLKKIKKYNLNVCLKISPAFSYSELEELANDYNFEIELISINNINKAALLLFGDFKKTERRATILEEDRVITFSDEKLENLKVKKTRIIKKYFYIVNKAISKARLINEIASLYNLEKVNSPKELLLSNDSIKFPNKLFRSFVLIDYDIFSIKNTFNLIKKYKINSCQIYFKNFYQNSEEIKKRFKLKEGNKNTLLLTEINSKKYICLLRNI